MHQPDVKKRCNIALCTAANCAINVCAHKIIGAIHTQQPSSLYIILMYLFNNIQWRGSLEELCVLQQRAVICRGVDPCSQIQPRTPSNVCSHSSWMPSFTLAVSGPIYLYTSSTDFFLTDINSTYYIKRCRARPLNAKKDGPCFRLWLFCWTESCFLLTVCVCRNVIGKFYIYLR